MSGDLAILLISKPPPPEMIRPVASIEALTPSRNDLPGAGGLAAAIFARAVACTGRLRRAAHKTSQTEQAEQAKPAPVAASTL